MARETKVGLLAGLAFIVCFAVILANRGGENAAHGTTVGMPATDVPGNFQRNLSRGPSHPNNKPRAATSPRTAAASQARPNVGTVTHSATSEPPMASSGADVLFNTEQGTSTLTVPWNNENREHSADGVTPSSKVERGPRPTMSSTATVPANSLVSDSPAKSVEQFFESVPRPEPSNIAQVSAQQPVAASERAATPHRSGTNYTVAPGDNLSKIALHQYGSKSRATVASIFEANRDVLSSPDAVRFGMKLVLPDLPGMQKAAESPKKELTAPVSAKPDEGKPASKLVPTSQAPTKTADSAKPDPKKTADSTKRDSKKTVVAKNSKEKTPAPKKLAASTKESTDMAAIPPAQAPAVSTITNVTEVDASKAEKPAARAKKDASADGFRSYQVKKNDRYVSIARDQLGDGSRWRELHELNKDKFPDPQQIREGVRIKLPSTSLVAIAEDKH